MIAADRHVANATRLLAHALRVHREEGKPLEGASSALNAERRESAARRVYAFGLDAGQSARFSGQLASAWAARLPEAWAVLEIREAMAAGWVATDRDLAGCTDVVESPEPGPTVDVSIGGRGAGPVELTVTDPRHGTAKPPGAR